MDINALVKKELQSMCIANEWQIKDHKDSIHLRKNNLLIVLKATHLDIHKMVPKHGFMRVCTMEYNNISPLLEILITF